MFRDFFCPSGAGVKRKQVSVLKQKALPEKSFLVTGKAGQNLIAMPPCSSEAPQPASR